MNTLATEIPEFLAFRPSRYGVLKSLSITQGLSVAGVHEQCVALVLIPTVDADDRSLHVDFYGVTKLNFEQSESSVIQLRLEILDGSEIPDVSARLYVHDAELDCVIRFECREFEAFESIT